MHSHFLKRKRIVYGSWLSGPCLLLTLLACQQSGPATDFRFRDVTATQLPQDAEAHTLDAAFADVDEDGDPDLVIALEAGVNRLYLNDGSGHFSWQQGVFDSTAHDTEHVRLADFNADGHLDVFFVAEDDQQHEYYLGNGDGTFQSVSDRIPAFSEGNGLDVGDVNGDGLPDVVVGNSGEEGQNFLWLNDPNRPGFFTDATQNRLPALNDATQSIKLADLDGDGDLDMVVGNEVPPNRLLLNRGDGHFLEAGEQLDIGLPLHTREVLVLDANGDNRPDIVLANLTSNGGEWDKDPQSRLLINQGKARFADETSLRMPENTFSTYAAAPVDFDQDGHTDLLLSAIAIPGFEAMQLHAYRNDGTGHYTDVTRQIMPADTKGRSWGIAVGDVNGDGKDDVFVGGWGTQARLLLAE